MEQSQLLHAEHLQQQLQQQQLTQQQQQQAALLNGAQQQARSGDLVPFPLQSVAPVALPPGYAWIAVRHRVDPQLRGVVADRERWLSIIEVNGVRRKLGVYSSNQEAAKK
jgi:hypothetical protein